jgi:membrane protein DedA with SNARE-associated domain
MVIGALIGVIGVVVGIWIFFKIIRWAQRRRLRGRGPVKTGPKLVGCRKDGTIFRL